MIKEWLYLPKDAAEILGTCTLTIKRLDKDRIVIEEYFIRKVVFLLNKHIVLN